MRGCVAMKQLVPVVDGSGHGHLGQEVTAAKSSRVCGFE